MIGARFKALREAAGLTQTETAEALLVSQAFLSKVEAEVKAPSADTVGRAAKLFGCTTDDLIYGEKPAGDAGVSA